MNEATGSMDAGILRMINLNVKLFNGATSKTLRTQALQRLFEFANLEGIIIYGLANYKPRSFFQGERNANCWYARVAIDRKNQRTPFVAIEERRDEMWLLQKLIQVSSIESIKTEVMGTDETRFHIYITVPNIQDIETPSCITF